jgi:hypothetical protein
MAGWDCQLILRADIMDRCRIIGCLIRLRWPSNTPGFIVVCLFVCLFVSSNAATASDRHLVDAGAAAIHIGLRALRLKV